MKFSALIFCTASVSLLLISCAASPASGGTAQLAEAQEMSAATPGLEHALLAKDVGIWDATVTSYGEKGPQVSKGVSTRRMTGGGLWQVEDFVGEMEGAPFVGHGVTGFDQGKKKFVGVWVDSMMSSIMATDGTYDQKSRKFTSTGMMEMGNGRVPVSMNCVSKDDDTQFFTMTMPGPDNAPMTAMTIEYKRRK